MTVSSFIKENRVLVAGLALPLLLIGLLAFVKTIPAYLVLLPQHKAMFMSQSWSDRGQIVIQVDHNGKLNPVFSRTVNNNLVNDTPNPTTALFLYDPKTNTLDETSVTLDKDGNVTPLEKFKDIQLSTQAVASDGYEFQPYSYSGRNSFITDIFSYQSYNSNPALTYKGRVIRIPPASRYYGTIEFLGWEK